MFSPYAEAESPLTPPSVEACDICHKPIKGHRKSVTHTEGGKTIYLSVCTPECYGDWWKAGCKDLKTTSR